MKTRRIDKARVDNSITNLSKQLLNINMRRNKLERLERLVLREEINEKPYAYSPTIRHRKTSSMHLPTGEGNQIYNFPKLPFGKHEKYNQDIKRGQFSRNHFYNSDSIDFTNDKGNE